MKVKQLGYARIGLAILTAGLLAASSNVAYSKIGAQVDLSVGLDIHSHSDFYSPLSPYGQWVDASRYGRCWHPAKIVSGWRPYTTGYWEWTDCGWYWVSDEPWAWACYHYGYWAMDPEYGWIWVPGTDWAPAWVVWRESPDDDYIGWAPCGPGGAVISDSFFVFVDAPHFHDHLGPRSLILNDPRILQRTRLVSNFRREDHDFGGVRRTVFANPGPGIDSIQRVTRTRFTPRPVADLVRQTRIPTEARRNLARSNAQKPPINQESRVNQEPSPSRTGREQQGLYREAQPVQPPPTGRQEQRLYREVPNPQPAPHPQPTPAQPAPNPRRQPVPEVPARPAVPRERAVPPAPVERGQPENQVPRREEPAPRIEPRPAPRPAAPPQTPPPGKEKEKERDGQ